MPPRNSAPAKSKVFAYGFENRFNFPTANSAATYDTPEASISFLAYDDKRRLDECDGVVVPQGIFERIEYGDNWQGDRYGKVQCDRDRMLERERQIRNLAERGWICFLVDEIVDTLPIGDGYRTYSVDNTDLCKLVLNGLGVERESIPEGLAGCQGVFDEFREYVRKHGIAKTVFSVANGSACDDHSQTWKRSRRN